MTEGTEKGNEKIVTENTITSIKTTRGNTPIDGVYAWNQLTGQKASSSGNIYGIYDLSGGSWERTAGYVANGDESLKKCGISIAYDGNTLKTVSTKYTIAYSHDNNVDKTGGNIDNASQANYAKNRVIYGDAYNETSTSGIGKTSWYGAYSYFPAITSPLTLRGGNWSNSSGVGLFFFSRAGGDGGYGHGFRPVLIAGVNLF